MRIIKTLDPKKMDSAGQEVYDISGNKTASFHIPSEGKTIWINYGFQVQRRQFPPDTVGVLYYHQPLDQPLLTGGIRIRLCPAVALFDEGEDLKLKYDQPWHIHLCNIAKFKIWKGLDQMLLKESLVNEQVLVDLRKLPLSGGRAHLHYSLEQPFILDMEHPSISRTFINQSMIYRFEWNPIWDLFKHPKVDHDIPYTGKSSRNAIQLVLSSQNCPQVVFLSASSFRLCKPQSRAWCLEFWTC